MNLLIRADASVGMGTGHVMRCLALAQAWQDAGGRVMFAMAEGSSSFGNRLRSESMEVATITGTPGSREDLRQTTQLAAAQLAQWVVVDGYHFGADYQAGLKGGGCKVLFVDDNGHAPPYSADLVLNQNAYASEDFYRDRVTGISLLLGPRYALLRREFRTPGEPHHETNAVGKRVLVTFGGSDVANLTMRVIQALDQVGMLGLEATFVVGGSNPHACELETALAKATLQSRLQRDVTNMRELMASADIAISAAGTTILELACMGVPSILVSVAENQQRNAEACFRLGIATSLGNLDAASPARIADALRELLVDKERRSGMSERGRALVDGLGAERVVTCLMTDGRRRNG